MPVNTLFIQTIQLNNYRSYVQQHFEFVPKLNCITGENGIGKTNLLDSVYYGCFSRSYFQKNDLYNYAHESSFLRLKMKVNKEENNYHITIVSKSEGGKIIEKDGLALERISHHLGQHPVVFFAPGDVSLIEGGSEERRRLMDSFIGQLDKIYVEQLSLYKKISGQRKSLLEMAFKRGRLDMDLLNLYNQQLHSPAIYIFEQRKTYSEKINHQIKVYYELLSNQEEEEVDWKYSSQLLEDDYETLLQKALNEDRARCTNSVGIHKDDYEFEIKNMSLKKTGSQGQQKTYLLSLKMAMFDVLQDATGIKPILLLDDIFDKLDKNRIDKLFQLIAEEKFGQIFISHTNKEDIDDICTKHGIEPHFIELKK